MDTQKVFVIDSEGKPLLPTHAARARKLLRAGKAQVYQVVPFAIQLPYAVEAPAGEFVIGIDDGAQEVGLAVVDVQKQEVVIAGVIQLRQDVSRKMTARQMYRRTRRSRATRYRAPRFRNRARTVGWLSPTIRQKKESVVRVVADLKRVINITQAVVEQGAFDTAALSAGQPLQGMDYQIPRAAGRNFRAKVLWRDSYICQHCGSQARLQAHHILPRAQGGTDTPYNGLTLCEDCHTALHAGTWVFDTQPRQFIYPAHLQAGKHYLAAQLEGLGLAVQTCVGWMTHYWRTELGLDKSHIHDAIAMVCHTTPPRLAAKTYHILPKRRKVWDSNPTKTCVEKQGFRHWDLVCARHRTRGVVISSVRSLKAKAITLRTAWDDNFAVSYRQARVVWRFNAIIYI